MKAKGVAQLAEASLARTSVSKYVSVMSVRKAAHFSTLNSHHLANIAERATKLCQGVYTDVYTHGYLQLAWFLSQFLYVYHSYYSF